MLSFNNHNISELNYQGHAIKKVYGCDGELVFDGEPNNKLTYVISGDTYTIPCNGSSALTMYEIIGDTVSRGLAGSSITDSIVGECVSSLAENCFTDSFSLSSVTIPNTVTSIGLSSFNNCYSLSSLTIPSVVTLIPYGLMNNCYNLSAFNIYEGVTSIGANAFYDCLSYLNITIPSTVISIGNYAFAVHNWSEQDPDFHDKMMYLKDNRVVTILATTPPTLGVEAFDIPLQMTTYKIYVPSESLEAYRTAPNWSVIASRIEPIP